MALNRWITEEEFAMAAENGISRRRLHIRVYEYEWDLEKAMTAPIGSVHHTPERKHGKWLKIAIENGISKSTFYSRLNTGWEYIDAANKPVRKKGKTEKKWLEIAKQNGINYQTFQSRVKTYKWDLETAATTPTINTGKRCMN